MNVRQWSQEPILVELPPEPQSVAELKMLVHRVRDRGACDVIVDFRRVGIFTSASLAELVRLRKLLTDCRHTLTLCRLSARTKGIFSVTGLDKIFTITDEEPETWATLAEAK